MFTYLTPLTYWLLIIIWSAILWFCIKRLRHRKIESAFFATVLLILTIDAARTLFESLYFGGWYTARAGLLPKAVFDFLVKPEMVFIPKAINLVAAMSVALLLLKKWLPEEQEEQLKVEQHIQKLEIQAREQERTETALRESEERFRNIVESSPMGIHLYETRPNGDLVFTGANPVADTILGINHDDLVGKTIEEAFPQLEFSEVPNRYRDICTFGRPWQTEDLHYKDGVISGAFHVTAFQTLPGRMAAQFLDITERKRTEEALTMTQFSVDNAAVSIFWIKPDGSFSYINNAACEMLGYSREKLLTMRVPDLTPDSAMRDMVWAKIKSIRYMTFELQAQRKDGSLFPAEITSHYIRFGEQEFEFAFVVDLTKRKKAEKDLADLNKNLEKLIVERTRDLENKATELEEANIRMSEVDRLKSSLLSSVTHELKTPLTSIIGYAKLVDRDFGRHFQPLIGEDKKLSSKSERLKENVSVIGLEGARLLGLIDNFLALSKIESGVGTWPTSKVNIRETILRAESLSKPHFATHPEVSLVVEMDDNLPTITADPDHLVQVILNLLDNATKFSPGGEVHLHAGIADNDTLHIAVTDSGPGVPEKDRERIFEAFHQVCTDKECYIKPSGAGMGLSICRQIVENYGGKIWLECPESGGSVFTVELPVENEAPNS